MDLVRIAATGVMGLSLLGSGVAASAQAKPLPGERPIRACLANKTERPAELGIMLKFTNESWDAGAGSGLDVKPGEQQCMDYRWPAERDVSVYAWPDRPIPHITGGFDYVSGGSVAKATCAQVLSTASATKLDLSFEVAMDGARAVCRPI